MTVQEVFGYSEHFGIPINFAIKAGSHHGTDKVTIAANHDMKMVYCFEPNPESRNIFLSKVEEKDVLLYPYGLFDSNTRGKLFKPTIDLGNQEVKSAGNSSLMPTWGESRGDSYEVELVRLGSFLEQSEIDLANLYGGTGLLWLDVEGVGLHSLQGMPNTLSLIAMAKIEIQYGKPEGQWVQSNIFQVVRFMIRKGFIPRKGYLHSLTRGDMFFVRRKHANFWEMTKAICYLLTAILFYGVIYPLWWKIPNRSKAA